MAIKTRNNHLAGLRGQVMLVVLGFAVIVLGACATQIPGQTAATSQDYRVYADSYDTVWGVVTSIMQNEGLSLDILDKDSGIINGIKDLEPSTMDMLMNYSVRIRTSVTIRRVEGNFVEVKISSNEERKYEERGWRPARDASAYSTALFDAFDRQLTVKSLATRPADVSPARPVAGTSPESNGSRITRTEIREAQQLLNALGHNAGAPDGVLGPKSTAAIASFQRASGISATGALDSQTLDALRRAAPTAVQTESIREVEKSASSNVGTKDGEPQAGVSVASGSAIASVRTSYALAETELKASADPFSSTITIIGKGRELKVLRDDGEWLHIQYDGREGYVFSEFVSP